MNRLPLHEAISRAWAAPRVATPLAPGRPAPAPGGLADSAQACLARGHALREAGRIEQAAESFRQALALRPGWVEALGSLGSALLTLGRSEESLACFDEVLRRRPGTVEALNNRGSALYELRRFDEALASHEAALRLRPDHASALSNRGNVLKELDRLDEALASFDRAVRLEPRSARAHANRGAVLIELGRCDEALTSFDQAIRLQPDYAEAHWNRGVALHLMGRHVEGWLPFEWRWRRRHAPSMRIDRRDPPWLGDAPPAGLGIVLHAEQGLGDTLQFSRYAMALAAHGARVTLLAQGALVPLLATSLPGVAVTDGSSPLPAHERHCPLMSLPIAFGGRMLEPPAGGAWLRPEPSRVERWRAWLGPRTRPRVGLVWSGNPAHRNDRRRSLPLARLLEALPPGLERVSLQKEVRETDRAALAQGDVRDPADRLRDFADTAALCSLLDLVISVDTSVAHLAAGLGRPTWILLPHVPDWRWGSSGEATGWYPSARLLRQGPDRGWGPVLARMTADLGQRFGPGPG
jgi:tetratricopeptide (TPR) repeat protein